MDLWINSRELGGRKEVNIEDDRWFHHLSSNEMRRKAVIGGNVDNRRPSRIVTRNRLDTMWKAGNRCDPAALCAMHWMRIHVIEILLSVKALLPARWERCGRYRYLSWYYVAGSARLSSSPEAFYFYAVNWLLSLNKTFEHGIDQMFYLRSRLNFL